MTWFFKELWYMACIAYYEAALAHIGGAHPDTSELVLKLRDLKEEYENYRRRSYL